VWLDLPRARRPALEFERQLFAQARHTADDLENVKVARLVD